MGDIKDAIEDVVDKAEQASDRLISVIAVLVAVLATVMALFSIKGGKHRAGDGAGAGEECERLGLFQAKSPWAHLERRK